MEYDKAKWGEGPWQTEPDYVEFIHEGLPCRMIRNNGGSWCGFVAIPSSHPDYGKDYDDIPVEVHGGLTCAHLVTPGGLSGAWSRIIGGAEWWLGFDCAHCFDYCPVFAELFGRKEGDGDVYRDYAYVQAEVKSLATQLKGRE